MDFYLRNEVKVTNNIVLTHGKFYRPLVGHIGIIVAINYVVGLYGIDFKNLQFHALHSLDSRLKHKTGLWIYENNLELIKSSRKLKGFKEWISKLEIK